MNKIDPYITADAIERLGEDTMGGMKIGVGDVRDFMSRIDSGFPDIDEMVVKECFDRLVVTLVYAGGNVSFRNTDSVETGTWIAGDIDNAGDDIDDLTTLQIATPDHHMSIRLEPDDLNLMIQRLQRIHDYLAFRKNVQADKSA